MNPLLEDLLVKYFDEQKVLDFVIENNEDHYFCIKLVNGALIGIDHSTTVYVSPPGFNVIWVEGSPRSPKCPLIPVDMTAPTAMKKLLRAATKQRRVNRRKEIN